MQYAFLSYHLLMTEYFFPTQENKSWGQKFLQNNAFLYSRWYYVCMILFFYGFMVLWFYCFIVLLFYCFIVLCFYVYPYIYIYLNCYSLYVGFYWMNGTKQDRRHQYKYAHLFTYLQLSFSNACALIVFRGQLSNTCAVICTVSDPFKASAPEIVNVNRFIM